MDSSCADCVALPLSKEVSLKDDVESTDVACNELDFHYGPIPGYKLKIIGSNLSKNSSVVLYLGENGEKLWNGVQQTGMRLVYLPLTSSIKTQVELYDLVCKAVIYVFDHVTKSGVYIVGHRIGALLTAKMLAQRDLLEANSRLLRLQAVFLISGIYNAIDDMEKLLHNPNETWFSLSLFKLTHEVMNKVSPLFDNFDHLCISDTRFYVFSAGDDDPRIQKQSRQMFDRLSDSCDQDDMHYEIKSKLGKDELLQLMYEPNNFLTRLLRYDIRLSQMR